MAIEVNLNLLDDLLLEKVTKDLTLTPESKFNKEAPVKDMYVFRREGNQAFIPFDYGNGLVKGYPNDERRFEGMKKMNFEVKMRDTQIPVIKEALDRLNLRRCVFLALHTGFGKTITAINLAWRAGLKTLIIYHRDLLVDQWVGSIKRCIPEAKVQILESGKKIDKDADFVICSVIKAGGRDDLYTFGTCILDECHALCSEVYSQSLLRMTPKFLIGLSASPDERSDGLGKVIDLHFGNHRIVKPLRTSFTLYKVNTGLDIPCVKNKMGKLDWNSVLTNQAESKERNDMLVKIISHFKDRAILVLCKRVAHADYLYKTLKALGDDAEILTSTKKKYNYNCRVLLTTYSKSGVGFDNPRLNMLIIAASVKEMFVQYLGRVFRGGDTPPIVVDLVDKTPSTLQAHWNERRRYYVEVGCERVNKLDVSQLETVEMKVGTEVEEKQIVLED